MSDQGTAPVHIAGVLARAAATGLVGAVVSAERHSVAMRRVGLVFAAGLGTAAGLAAAGILSLPKGEDVQLSGEADGGVSEAAPSTEGAPEQVSLPPAAAAALGLATFALTAGVSEAGLRAQRQMERWADAAFSRPRLAVGLLTGVTSLALDLVDKRSRRHSAVATPIISAA